MNDSDLIANWSYLKARRSRDWIARAVQELAQVPLRMWRHHYIQLVVIISWIHIIVVIVFKITTCNFSPCWVGPLSPRHGASSGYGG